MALINTTTTGVLGTTISGDGTGPLNVQQNGVTIGIYGNIPAFSAYLSANQTAPSLGTWTKVALDAEVFDTNNNFASNRFTPTVAGYYQINATVHFAAGSTSLCSIAVYKNGSSYSQGTTASPSIMYALSHSTLVFMNGSTDYLELWTYVSNSSAILGGTTNTVLSGSLVKAT